MNNYWKTLGIFKWRELHSKEKMALEKMAKPAEVL